MCFKFTLEVMTARKAKAQVPGKSSFWTLPLSTQENQNHAAAEADVPSFLQTSLPGQIVTLTNAICFSSWRVCKMNSHFLVTLISINIYVLGLTLWTVKLCTVNSNASSSIASKRNAKHWYNNTCLPLGATVRHNEFSLVIQLEISSMEFVPTNILPIYLNLF